jgi:mono/diheme cytochrome c family protein
VSSLAGGSTATPSPEGASSADNAPPADAGAFGFRRDIYPIFVTYCGQCHRVNGPYHDIASADVAEAYADAIQYADRVVARIEQGNMPPGCVFDDAACVPPEALLSIKRWIEEGSPP